MSDNTLINLIREDKALNKIWDALTTDETRAILGFAEGDERLAALALEEAKEK